MVLSLLFGALLGGIVSALAATMLGFGTLNFLFACTCGGLASIIVAAILLVIRLGINERQLNGEANSLHKLKNVARS